MAQARFQSRELAGQGEEQMEQQTEEPRAARLTILGAVVAEPIMELAGQVAPA